MWRKFVQTDHRDAGTSGDPLEGLGDGVRVDRLAFGASVNTQSGVVDADGVVLGGLVGARQAAQDGDGRGVEVDAAARVVGLAA